MVRFTVLQSILRFIDSLNWNETNLLHICFFVSAIYQSEPHPRQSKHARECVRSAGCQSPRSFTKQWNADLSLTSGRCWGVTLMNSAASHSWPGPPTRRPAFGPCDFTFPLPWGWSGCNTNADSWLLNMKRSERLLRYRSLVDVSWSWLALALRVALSVSCCWLMLQCTCVYMCVCVHALPLASQAYFFHIPIRGSVMEYWDIRNRPWRGSWLLCLHSFKWLQDGF